MNTFDEVNQLYDELVELRRTFHQYPELGFQEYGTSKIIADYLESCGIEVTRKVAKTGVVGLLRGHEDGRTLLLRSDMDALPLHEETGLPYASKNSGIMHGCGHDGHMAMLLVAAKVLSKKRDKLKGNVKFVFQPNEEDAGAEIMIRQGILENPRVDAALGIHLWSPIETGKIGIVPGPIMASSYYFKIDLQGKGGHGGAPHRAIDPITCAMNIIQSVQTMQAKELDALSPTVISFCNFHSGTSPIIVPETAVLEGSIRCLHDQYPQVQNRFEAIVDSVCALNRTRYNLSFKCGNDLLSNSSEMTQRVIRAAEKIIGAENVEQNNIPVMLGEDYAEFTKHVPAAFYFVGVSNSKLHSDYPHHHPKFNIDEAALPIGAALHVQSALDYLAE